MGKHRECIYQLKFKNGQVYVGRSSDTQFRYKRHIAKMKSGIHYKRVQNAYNLFGEPKLEILAQVKDDEYAPELEANYIAGAGARSLNSAHASYYEQYFTSKKKYKIVIRHLWSRAGLC